MFHETFWLANKGTAQIPFHEAFWLATAAAAPVIALAAMLLLPEWAVRHAEASSAAVDAEIQGRKLGSTDTRPAKLSKMASAIRVTSAFNIVLQAVVLAMSLLSLQDQRNFRDPFWATTITVGGLLWLAWSSWQAGRFRAEWKELHPVKGPGRGA